MSMLVSRLTEFGAGNKFPHGDVLIGAGYGLPTMAIFDDRAH
jgi:hypothetical protein